jgi:hypothetical protein
VPAISREPLCWYVFGHRTSDGPLTVGRTAQRAGPFVAVDMAVDNDLRHLMTTALDRHCRLDCRATTPGCANVIRFRTARETAVIDSTQRGTVVQAPGSRRADALDGRCVNWIVVRA